jgi:hypothetical protein
VLVAVSGVTALGALANSAADGISTTPAVTSTTATTTTEPVTTEPDQAVLLKQCNRSTVKYRSQTWYWQHLMGRSRTRSHYKPGASNTLPYCQAVLKLWHGRAVRWYSAARRWMPQRILEYRRNVRYWRLVVTGEPARDRTLAAGGSLVEQFRRWHRAERHWHQLGIHPPYLSDWFCIHRYEGSWTDSGSPYWGGLQMDLSFQQTYGGWLLRHKGTADHWTPLEQIWAAVRASRTRGFSPWPNTARDCGLY